MKICLITPFYYPKIGGAEIFSQYLAEYLVKRGYKLDVVNLSLANQENKVEKINQVSIHRITMGNIKYFSFIAGFIKLLVYLYNLDKLKNYDLFHSVGDGLSNSATGLIKRLRGKKHLNTLQGLDIFSQSRSSFSKTVLKILYWLNFKNIDSVHVVSSDLGIFIKQFGAKDIFVIPNGVDMKIFKPMNKKIMRKKYGFKVNEKIILSVGRLEKVKNHNILVKVFTVLSHKIKNIRLIIIGEGSQKQKLETLIERLDLSRQIQILGPFPHRLIPQYLNIADLFVLPSFYEGCSIAIIEAMACKIPVICTAVDGVLNIIEDGKNGFSVSPKSVPQIAQAIKVLLGNRNLRSKFVKEGLTKVTSHYIWLNNLALIEKKIMNLIST